MHTNVRCLSAFFPGPVYLGIIALIAGCGTTIERDSEPEPVARAIAPPSAEPLSWYGNPNAYEVFGKRYYPLKSSRGFVETGIASWYGPGFHGRLTSTREIYDMYQMTAAHKLLPLPTYVEVTNLQNGRKIVVRINDRGPFYEDRVIDLSYAAANKLGILYSGTGIVRVRAIDPSDLAPRLDFQPPLIVSGLKPGASWDQHPTALSTSVPAGKSLDRTIATTARLNPSASPPGALEPPRVRTAAIKSIRYYLQLGAFADKTRAEGFRHRIYGMVQQPVRIQPVLIAGKPIYKVQVGPLANVEAVDQIIRTIERYGLRDHRLVVN
jgi:peptidoglycan lytic transglycosylase